MLRYDQKKSERLISQMLIDKGFLISRTSSDLPKYSIQAFKEDKKVHILVRHLEFDLAYKESVLPYQVYKIEAFDNNEERKKGTQLLHFVVGYNFRDDSFACVPINEFYDKRSTVVHQREGLRAVYYNNWTALEEYVV